MIKVAFSTDDGLSINTHFGQCTQFAVYSLDKEHILELPVRPIDEEKSKQPAPLGAGADSGKIEARVDAILDCTLVYITQIGPAAAARLTQRRVMPIKVEHGTSIQEQLEKLHAVLQGTPPLWLAKALAYPKN